MKNGESEQITDSTGYEMTSWTVNGTSFYETPYKITVSGYDDSATYIITTFQEISNGTINLDKVSAKQGEIVTVTATPADGYKLKYITVNGTRIDGNSFVVTENAEVSAVFEKETGGCSSSVQPVGVLGFAVVAMVIGGLLISLRKKVLNYWFVIK